MGLGSLLSRGPACWVYGADRCARRAASPRPGQGFKSCIKPAAGGDPAPRQSLFPPRCPAASLLPGPAPPPRSGCSSPSVPEEGSPAPPPPPCPRSPRAAAAAGSRTAPAARAAPPPWPGGGSQGRAPTPLRHRDLPRPPSQVTGAGGAVPGRAAGSGAGPGRGGGGCRRARRPGPSHAVAASRPSSAGPRSSVRRAGPRGLEAAALRSGFTAAGPHSDRSRARRGPAPALRGAQPQGRQRPHTE